MNVGGQNEVGYGRPPAQHQYKPGQSGNPRGRPRDTHVEFKTLVARGLDERVRVQTPRGVKATTVREVLAKKLIAKALDLDPKAWKLLLQLTNNFNLNFAPDHAVYRRITKRSQRIMDAFLQDCEPG